MAVSHLPMEYEEIKRINLVNDKKASVAVNIMSFALIAVLLVAGALMYGTENIEHDLLLSEKENVNTLIRHVMIIIILCVIYMVLHEVFHAVVMKLLRKESRVSIGIDLFYAYASSSAYYTKRSYNIISIAPLIFFGVLLSILCAAVPMRLFWVFYVVQILNFSVAAGDFYIFIIISRMPKDILIKDSGTEIVIYGK